MSAERQSVGIFGGSGLIARFARDRRGVSAVEFALIAPLMIAFYFGVTEFCQGFMAQKRMTRSAASVADLVAQTDVVTKDELADILAIGQTIMQPYSTSTLTLRVSSVTRGTNGVAKVDWSAGTGVTPLAKQSTVTVPADILANGESIIMSESTYGYTSPVQYLMPGVTEFDGKFYSRPRKVDKVGCSDC